MAQFKTPLNKIKDKLFQMRREAEERDAKRLASKSSFPYTDLTTTPINIEALRLISEEESKKAKIAAIEIKEKKIVLVIFDPDDSGAKSIIEKLKSEGYSPSIFVVSLSGLNHVWSFYKFVIEKPEEITGRINIEEKKLVELKNTLTSLENIKAAVQKFNSEIGYAGEILEIVLGGALANRASDIHFEPTTREVRLRLRVDGLLHDVFDEIKQNTYNHLISRIKLLSGLKLNIHNEPQDGRFTIKLPEKEIEVRVVVAPSEFGEAVVMRLLDPNIINFSLIDLGIRSDDLEIIRDQLKKPNGMILNTGPTGSGKTTTLYAFLKHKKNPEIKVITIEDPIEYHLEGIEQTQVDEEAGYTFSNGLRSLMRQDPDVILVGEIRDKETGEIAVQAALTGHLVFSTLHTNEAAGAIPRLLDLGVKSTSIGPALNLIIAQRLVRRLCPECKIPQEIDEALNKKIEKFLNQLPKRVDREEFKEVKIYKTKGCDKCNNIGYKGRIGIFELLLNSLALESLIKQDAGESSIKKFALEQEAVTMQQDGLLKVISGITTFDEVERATGILKL